MALYAIALRPHTIREVKTKIRISSSRSCLEFPCDFEGLIVATVRFLRSTLFAEGRLGIRDLRVKSAVRQIRQYALFAAIRIKPNYALFSL